MNLEYIFPTPIWSVDFNFDLTKMKEFVLEEREKNNSRQISNIGGWQSNDFYPSDFSNTEFKNFFSRIQSALQQCFYDYGTEQVPVVDNIWFNINRKGNYNASHFHAGPILSACFYIKSPEDSGSIVFERSTHEDYIISSKIGLSTSRLAASKWRYQAIENRLLLFPAWLSHKVEENNSNEERISMAFNIKAK